MIKVLRESLVATNVHRVLGIVNGTTNFILSQMEQGAEYEDALAEAQRLGFAEPDPTEDVNGADAAAKMAILATVAFGSRTTLDDVEFDGIERITQEHVRAAREMEMTVRLVGSATLVDDKLDVRVQPSLVDRHHPLAAVEGPFNAVMLQGDAIREITLEGPGAGGLETASAVVADMISIIGTTGTGFLQNDACWRELERLPRGDLRSPFYVRVEVADEPGVLAHIAQRLAEHDVSIARLVQHQRDGGATLHVVTHEARAGASRRQRSRRSPRCPRRSRRRRRCPSSRRAASPGRAGRDPAHRALPRPPAARAGRPESSRSTRAPRRSCTRTRSRRSSASTSG